MTTTFLITSLVIVATPGTGALYAITAGLAHGRRAAFLAAFAGVVGTLPHLAAAITGLAAVLHASGVAFAVLKYAGAAYLLWMAWSTWRDAGALEVDRDAARTSAWRVVGNGVTLNLLNPKLTIFFFAFLPQFVPADGSALGPMLGLSAVFVAMTFLVFTGYGLFAAAVRDQVLGRPRVLNGIRKVFAVTFAGLGLRLATESR